MLIKYCSVAHQTEDRKAHRELCKAVQALSGLHSGQSRTSASGPASASASASERSTGASSDLQVPHVYPQSTSTACKPDSSNETIMERVTTGWYKGMAPAKQHEWLVDCYRLRLDDYYVKTGETRGLYAAAANGNAANAVDDFLVVSSHSIRNIP